MALFDELMTELYNHMDMHFKSQDVRWWVEMKPERQHSPLPVIECHLRTDVRHAHFRLLVHGYPSLASPRAIARETVRKLQEAWNHG